MGKATKAASDGGVASGAASLLTAETALRQQQETSPLSPSSSTQNSSPTTGSSRRTISASNSDQRRRMMMLAPLLSSSSSLEHDKKDHPDNKPLSLQRGKAIIKDVQARVRNLPPKYKFCFCLIWVLWKIVVFFIIIVLISPSPTSITSNNNHHKDHVTKTAKKTKLLYIVTSLAEYNNGRRNTIQGQDRLQEIMVPVLVDSLSTFDKRRFDVDVYLILAYELRQERHQYIRNKLPSHVGLQVWDDACPISYEKKGSDKVLKDNTRALARQHRYVIKDKLLYYDLFMSWEDDMRITQQHVEQYLSITKQIERITPISKYNNNNNNITGSLTQTQINRLIPGFIRVEVLQNPNLPLSVVQMDANNNKKNSNKKKDNSLTTTTTTNTSRRKLNLDPKVCCHIQQDEKVMPTLTNEKPQSEDLVIWETALSALSVRKLPFVSKEEDSVDHDDGDDENWIVLLPGPGKRLAEKDKIYGLWSGQVDGKPYSSKPSPGEPHLLAQQGGWMATKSQIIKLQLFEEICQGSFLPPFDEPIYRHDGQESMNVEFWSGGYQLFTGVRGGCNLQRVVALNDKFANHLLYHVANNKQKQLAKSRFVRANDLWIQLQNVKRFAEQQLLATVEQQQQQQGQQVSVS